jgi:DNA-binding CsgD family transcriptional regulator
MMELPPEEYEKVMNVLRSDRANTSPELLLKSVLENPFFNRLQAFSNQSIRILDNSELKYLYVSESVYDLTGYTQKEMAEGGLWFTYKKIHPIDLLKLGRILLKLNRLLATLTDEEKLSSRFTFDIRFKCKNGLYKYILQNVHTLTLSPKGKPYILLFTSTDITAYKKGDAMTYSFGIQKPGKGFVNVMEGNLQSDDFPLTDREVEVLRLTSEGLSEQEISDRLFLSKETVKTHRRNMLQKTEAKNSVELVRMGIANGWI